jgi:peptide/nickel transport system substrate-binding protein
MRIRGQASRHHLVGLLLALFLMGCEQPEPQGLRFGLASEPLTLDPRFATDAAGERIARLLFAALTDHDEQGRAVPALADWMQESPNRYRFILKEGRADFADGSPLTARDVVATYRAILDPATGSPHRQGLQAVSSVSADGEDQVIFALNRPDPLLPGRLNLGILPAHQAASPGRLEQPLGSGPFAYLGRAAGVVRLQRRSDGLRLAFEKVADPTVRALKLVRGELDLIQNDLPPEIRGWLAGQPGVRLAQHTGDTFAYLGFNLADAATGQRQVRQAIAHAIDRAALIHHLFQDGAVPAESVLPPSHWAGHPGLAPHRYDPERARGLLADIGHGPERPLSLVYKTSADPFRLRLAAAIQAQLAEVGIRVSIQSYDWGTFYGDIKAGRFQLYSLAWVGVKSPDILRHIFHSRSLPPDGANRGRYRSPRVDRALTAAANAVGATQQAGAYRQVQAQVHQDLVYVPLWYEHHVAAMGPRVRGYGLRRDGAYDALARVTLAAKSEH